MKHAHLNITYANLFLGMSGAYSEESKISVVFNDKFCRFITTLKRDRAGTVELLKTSEISILMKVQKDLREYIMNHQTEFDSSRIGNTSYPDMFAIMICIILPTSELNTDKHKSFQSILDATVEDNRDMIRMTGSLYSHEEGIESSDAVISRDIMCCACNHTCKPHNLFLISNETTDLNLLIGCDCIRKTKFIEDVKLNNMIKASKSDPAYKAVERQHNISIMAEKLKDEDETVQPKSLMENYVYRGGNYDSHIEYCNQRVPSLDINQTIGTDNTCFICKDEIDNFIFIERRNGEDLLCICAPCCRKLELYPKPPANCCEECGEAHRNRSHNMCNACKKNHDQQMLRDKALNRIVSFGKYKNRTYGELVHDTNYLEWLQDHYDYPDCLQTAIDAYAYHLAHLPPKIYLSVDFEDKDDAKDMGARWDSAKKKWYIPPEMAGIRRTELLECFGST